MLNLAERQPLGALGNPPNFAFKKVPESIVVFGATGHVGGPVAQQLTEVAPEIQLRLITSNPRNVELLQGEYPKAEVMVANLNDLETTMKAMKGMEGAFVVTQSVIDAKRAMTNVVASAYDSDTLTHLVRFQGENNEIRTEADLHPLVRDIYTDPKSNLHARQVLELSDLPWTICNGAAYFFDNLIRFFGSGIRNERIFATPHNHMTSVADSRDFGAACAMVLLSDDARNVNRSFQFDNGVDWFYQSEIAEVMSEVLGEKITHVSGTDEHLRICAEDVETLRRQASAATGVEISTEAMVEGYLRPYWNWDVMVDKCMSIGGWMEYFLGRKPITLAEWVDEHRDALLGKAPAVMSNRFAEIRPYKIKEREDGLGRLRARTRG